MRKKEVIFVTIFIHQAIAQPSYAGSGIHNDNIIAFGSDLETGGISAVFDIFYP